MRRIKVRREQKKLTQTQLGKKLGIPQPNMARIERPGYWPKGKTLFVLADILGCAIEDLID